MPLGVIHAGRWCVCPCLYLSMLKGQLSHPPPSACYIPLAFALWGNLASQAICAPLTPLFLSSFPLLPPLLPPLPPPHLPPTFPLPLSHPLPCPSSDSSPTHPQPLLGVPPPIRAGRCTILTFSVEGALSPGHFVATVIAHLLGPATRSSFSFHLHNP